MRGSKYLYGLIMLFGCQTVMAQTAEIHGQIIARDEVEGIHILNITSQTFTISTSEGRFSIVAKLQDTLTFSGISYELKQVVVNQEAMDSKYLKVYLSENVNILDEVVVGKVLTGDLSLDLSNSDLKRQPNFYDLGIPGYAGKPKTQSERRLYEATSGAGLIPLNPIINAITGQTKRLKEHVKLEALEACLDKMKSAFSDDLFANYDLAEARKADYFYYCQEDPEFEGLCHHQNDLEVFQFLVAKLRTFQTMIQTEKE